MGFAVLASIMVLLSLISIVDRNHPEKKEEITTLGNTKPVVWITHPSDISIVKGIVNIQGTATDPEGDETIEKVEVRMDEDGEFVDITGTTSWSYPWNTTTTTQGTHMITARAFDGELFSSPFTILVCVLNEQEQMLQIEKVSVTVKGSVVFDTGEAVENAKITATDLNKTAFSGTLTDAFGNFELNLNLSLPCRVLVEANYVSESYPVCYSAKWGLAETDLLLIDKMSIPNPQKSQLALSEGFAENEDGSIQIEGLPESVYRIFARSYDPDENPEAFPGEFEEGFGPIELNSVVFVWLEALDSEGEAVDEFSSPLKVRVKVPYSQWVDLKDIKPGNDRIEIPIYTFDEEMGIWEYEDDPGWLEDANGTIIPEDDEEYILERSFPGDVYAVFVTDHFTFMNVDYAYIGPWKLDKINPKYRNNKHFFDALNLAKDMMYSKPGREAFEPLFNEPWPWSPDLKEGTESGKGPSIDTIPPDRSDEPLQPYGRYSGDSGGSENEIYINENTWDYIQSDSSEDHKKNAVLHMAITILHETAHWMNDIFVSPNPGDVSGKESYPDTGDRLEERLFWDLLGEYKIKLQLDGSLDLILVDINKRVHRMPLENDLRDKLLDKNHWNKRGVDEETMIKDNPINITISMDSYFTASDPVIVTVNYKNDGDSTIWIPNKIILENNPVRFNITHIASQTFMGFKGPQHSYNFRAKDYDSLEPGQSFSISCDLRYDDSGLYSRYRLFMGGEYEINAVYKPIPGYHIVESNRLTFTMQGAGNLSGNVINSITDESIADATVSVIQNARILRKTRTDSLGRYNFTYLPPGTYMVKARIPGTKSVFQYNVEILPEETTWLNLYLFTGKGPQFTKIGSWDDESEGLARRVTVRGDLAFVADLLDGMKIINISDPANPWLVGKFKDGEGAKTFDVAVSGSFAYIADERYGLKIIDISDPSNPFKVGEFKDGGFALGVEVVDSLVYVADQSDGLEIIDVSDPKNPFEKGQFFDGGSATDLCIVGNLVYIADGGAGLDIIDVSDSSNPWKVGGITTNNAVGIDIEGDYAYVASMEGGLRIIDISRPDKPQEKGWYKEFDSDRAHDVDVVFPYAYVAFRGKGLDILDISDPTHIEKLDNFFNGGQSDGVQVLKGLVYIADKEDGLEILMA